MSEQRYKYIIVGAGLAGGSAVEGIRQLDAEGTLLLVGSEGYLPYHRPPLSKKLWFGEKQVPEIFLQDNGYYAERNVDVLLGRSIVHLDPEARCVTADNGVRFQYEKLLIATGGIPRHLDIPGGELEGIFYYRYLDDYLRLRQLAKEGASAVIIGGGYIGSEMAAALCLNKLKVTMVFPEPYIVYRVFPEELGRKIQQEYLNQGVQILTGDVPVSIEKNGDRFITRTKNGSKLHSDIILAGIGIEPSVALAKRAGLAVDGGIVVDEYLQTSAPGIYAAGDNAAFPYRALGVRMRVEHWDNALNQGRLAGRNMAGAHEPYDYMPYFFSDLFEFGYEAVGDVNSSLETFADWQVDSEKGVIYYLRDGKVRGVMACNLWDKMDAARELILKGDQVTPESLRGAIV